MTRNTRLQRLEKALADEPICPGDVCALPTLERVQRLLSLFAGMADRGNQPEEAAHYREILEYLRPGGPEERQWAGQFFDDVRADWLRTRHLSDEELLAAIKERDEPAPDHIARPTREEN